MKVPWNKGKYGIKKQNYLQNKEVECIYHGIHNNWHFDEKHNQLTCRLCSRDIYYKTKQKDSYVFGRFITNIKSRCKKTNREFGLTEKFIADLYIKQNGKCALSGIELLEDNMSIDRIDSNKGYTKNNIQWVDLNINRMKTNLIQEDFIELCGKVYALSVALGKKKKK